MLSIRNAAIFLIALAALGFVLAVFANMAGGIMGVAAEGFSRACSNLALMAIALGIWFKETSE
jgi:hypothetical protein